MSNLVKQYYAVECSNQTRIINSNKKIEEKLKVYQQAKMRESVTSEDGIESEGEFSEGGFVEGLSVKVMEEKPKVTEEEILEKARAEADKIIREAKENADSVMEEALRQADELFEEKKRTGYEEGLSEGQMALEDKRVSLMKDIEEEREKLQSEYKAKFDVMESDLIDAIIQVFNKVFHIQFDNKKEIMLHLVKNTLRNVEVGRVFRIHVSDNNYRFMDSHLKDIRERIGNDVEVEIINDANLGPEDCQIETSFGVFDCGIDMELNNLVKDIRSLCS